MTTARTGTRSGLPALAVLAACLAGPLAAAAEERPTAVFDVELYDTSGEGMNDALQRRIDLASAELRRLVDASDRYRVLPPEALAERTRTLKPLYGCNGCEGEIARDLGAEVAFAAVVHKISTLILQIRITGRDTASGETFVVAEADIRGDNDKSWLHGIRWLAEHRLDL